MTDPDRPCGGGSSRSRAPIGTRFCGARGRCGGSEPTIGRTAAVRSAIRLTSSFSSRPDASHRTMPVHEWPPAASQGARTTRSGTRRPIRRIVNSGVRCPARVPRPPRSARAQIDDAVRLDVTDHRQRRERLFSGPVGDDERPSRELCRQLTLGATHPSMELLHQM